MYKRRNSTQTIQNNTETQNTPNRRRIIQKKRKIHKMENLFDKAIRKLYFVASNEN
jgi:hypothetical protein